MKNKFIPLLSVVGLCCMGNLHAQISSRSTAIKTSLNIHNRVSNCNGGNYENLGDVDFGYTSQIFEEENQAFSSELADDFVTPATASVICNISITGATLNGAGFPGNQSNKVRISIYNDQSGNPGELIFSKDFTGSHLDPDNTGSFNLSNFSDSPILTPNTKYWLSIQAVMGFADSGQWYWKYAPTPHDNSWKWRNPGDGFGTGCTKWQEAKDCLDTEGLDANMKIEFTNFLASNELLENELTIYPNPATSEVSVKLPAGIRLTDMEVLDMTGKSIPLRITGNKADIRKLPVGSYVLAVNTSKGKVIRKLLKK